MTLYKFDKPAIVLFIGMMLLLITILHFAAEYSIRSMELRVSVGLLFIVSSFFILRCEWFFIKNR